MIPWFSQRDLTVSERNTPIPFLIRDIREIRG
jgi:hypothetical protein